ncbi:hypothetical protein L6250_01480 [Candidatus Parcubacteria bacterium]|nr:hypothetical protein [Candidatus Parcubacteria bacterium]
MSKASALQLLSCQNTIISFTKIGWWFPLETWLLFVQNSGGSVYEIQLSWQPRIRNPFGYSQPKTSVWKYFKNLEI